MKPIFLAAVSGVLLAASLCAQAGQSARAPSPLDPKAAVPALAYDSALNGHARAGADAAASPDKNWRRANDAVGGDAGGDREPAHGGDHGSAAAAHGHHHPTTAKQ